MKKVIALVSALCMLFMLSGCKGVCNECGQTAKVTKYTIMGNEVKICDNCKAALDQLTGGLDKALDQLQDLAK